MANLFCLKQNLREFTPLMIAALMAHIRFWLSYGKPSRPINPPNLPLRILILGILSDIGPFSINMYLPVFSVMSIRLGTSVDRKLNDK